MFKAKKVALKKYFQSMPSAKQRQLKELEREFYKNIDDFVIGVEIQQEKNDENNSTYAIAISASINAGAIDAFFQANSAAGNQITGEESEFFALFLARRVLEAKSFDAKRADVSETESSQSQVEENKATGGRSVSGSTDKTIDVRRTGGSTSRKSTQYTYKFDLSLSDDVEKSVGSKLTDAGFAYLGIGDLSGGVPFLDEIKLGDNGMLRKRTVNNYERASKQDGLTFFGIGNVDVFSPVMDRARGILKVAAKATFVVKMLDKRGRYKVVATSSPMTVYGSDGNGEQAVAETNAYNNAIAKVMAEVIAKLQQKGLR
jgi:hypothetical protein